MIVVADLMKSVCIVKYVPGEDGVKDELKEIGRHYQTVWSTAVACVDQDTFLLSEAEGNLIVLSRNTNGVTDQDKHRLIPTSEIALGEMVNRIRPIHIPQLASVTVTPRAFMATVCTASQMPTTTANLSIGRGIDLSLRTDQSRTPRLPNDPSKRHREQGGVIR